MRREYLDQARLMLRVMPHVARESCFALKGGTAINFFVWDMPRLSVDIDLTYLPVEPRAESLRGIAEALGRVKSAVGQAMPEVKVRDTMIEGRLSKLTVLGSEGEVKIEPNLVIRGAIGPTAMRGLSKRAQERFELAVTIRTLSEADIFGGKICAALDRQHPRDLFDVKKLLDGPGLTEEIRKAFIVYLISHDRPMHEVIDPNRKDVRESFESAFKEMTDEPVAYEALIDARERLIERLQTDLSRDERFFLVSVKEGKPDWALLGLEGVENLPAVRWKLINIKKMPPKKHAEQLRKLKERLGLA